jgi:MoxR-like ATPase
MAKKQLKPLRLRAEIETKKELEQLKSSDKGTVPPGWKLSPGAVVEYIMGNDDIRTKYIGDRSKIEMAVATLASGRALLLMGVPGTAKTVLAEHLSAAISGDSSHIVQGTSGMYEEALKYSWNYAELLARGPSQDALVPSPILKAMQEGKIARIEELTRIPSDVQDALLMILSEKSLPIPELNTSVSAVEGFNLIATANEKDRGVNALSAALQRRLNTIHMPLPATIDEEVNIVMSGIEAPSGSTAKNKKKMRREVEHLVQIFRELRSGQTEDGQTQFPSPQSTLSSAEAISVLQSALAYNANFSKSALGPRDLSLAMAGTVIKHTERDKKSWHEYLERVLKSREGWEEWYKACTDQMLPDA